MSASAIKYVFKYSGYAYNTARCAIVAYMKLQEELTENSTEIRLSESSLAAIRELKEVVAGIYSTSTVFQSVEYVMKAINLFENNLLRHSPTMIGVPSPESAAVAVSLDLGNPDAV